MMVFLPQPPKDVRMSNLRSEISNGPIGDSLFALVEVGKDVSVALLASWLYDRIKQYDAERIKINGQEPADRSDFDRIVAESVQIGKND